MHLHQMYCSHCRYCHWNKLYYHSSVEVQQVPAGMIYTAADMIHMTVYVTAGMTSMGYLGNIFPSSNTVAVCAVAAGTGTSWSRGHAP